MSPEEYKRRFIFCNLQRIDLLFLWKVLIYTILEKKLNLQKMIDTLSETKTDFKRKGLSVSYSSYKCAFCGMGTTDIVEPHSQGCMKQVWFQDSENKEHVEFVCILCT